MIPVSELFHMTSDKTSKATLDTLDISTEPFSPEESLQDRDMADDQDIPTLEEIAFHSNSIENLLSGDIPLPEELREADAQAARHGLSQEDLASLTEQLRKQLLKELSTHIQAYINKTIARTVAMANRNMRNQILKQVEASLPGLIEQAIARSRDEN